MTPEPVCCMARCYSSEYCQMSQGPYICTKLHYSYLRHRYVYLYYILVVYMWIVELFTQQRTYSCASQPPFVVCYMDLPVHLNTEMTAKDSWRRTQKLKDAKQINILYQKTAWHITLSGSHVLPVISNYKHPHWLETCIGETTSIRM